MNYAMFTDAGNDAVDAIVRRARVLGCTWEDVIADLYKLAEMADFAEATDTAVREAVWVELGFGK